MSATPPRQQPHTRTHMFFLFFSMLANDLFIMFSERKRAHVSMFITRFARKQMISYRISSLSESILVVLTKLLQLSEFRSFLGLFLMLFLVCIYCVCVNVQALGRTRLLAPRQGSGESHWGFNFSHYGMSPFVTIMSNLMGN